jgi:hypothetical protein
MDINSWPFGKKGFLIRKLIKEVDVEENGHGTVNYEIRLARKNKKVNCIEHQIGYGESIPAAVRLETLKSANKAFEQGSQHDMLHGYNFTVKSILSPYKKLAWQELAPYRNVRRFEIDFKKTYGKVEEISYGYGWTHPKMFTGALAKGELSSSVRISYPTEALTLRVNFPWQYPLKHGPKLKVFDINGNETSLKIKYESENLFAGAFDLRLMHFVGKRYQVTIPNPPHGFTFKTVWRTK